MQAEHTYSLGTSEAERQRLEQQADRLAAPTRLLLQRAGLGPGMRVLDLGSGVGDVAFLAAELVGPGGQVVGVERSPETLAVAERRRVARGLHQVTFRAGDVLTFRDERPFDFVVGRLIFIHLPDAVAAVRHHAAGLAPGGRLVALDYDCGAIRSEPPAPLIQQARDWLLGGFRAAGVDPVIGARLRPMLRAGGLADVDGLGLQDHVAPGDPYGAAQLTAVVRSLLPAITRAGIATAEHVGIDTLADRITAEQQATGATLIPPTLCCAWGTRA